MIKLLVLDIDGTISGSSNQINDTVKKAIQQVQEKGVTVAIATGRMYHSAQYFYHDLALSSPLMSYNGAWIQNPKTNHFHRHLPVNYQYLNPILDYLENCQFRDIIDIHCYFDDQLYVKKITDLTEIYMSRSRCTAKVINDFREKNQQSPTKILIIARNPDISPFLLTDLKVKFPKLHFTQSTSVYLEITHPQANKGDAVQYLAETVLGLQSNNVMTIGDSFNDLEMIQYAGVGIAMGDAPEKVQSSADWVTQDVNQDGVVKAIEKFIF